MATIKYKNGSDWYNAGFALWPVGALYLSQTNSSPAGTLGGSWTPVTGGRALRANASWGDVGSSTITTSNMPSHTHWVEKSTTSGWGKYLATSSQASSGGAAGYGLTAAPSFENRVIIIDNSTTNAFRAAATGGGVLILHYPKMFIAGIGQHSSNRVVIWQH